MMISTRPSTIFSAITICGLLAGCGGGASTEPTVKIKSAKQTETGGGQQTGGGGGEATAESFGSWTGRVAFEGSPPELDPLVRQGAEIKDANVCAAITVPNESLVVGSNNGVANVFIFMPRAPSGAKQAEVPQEPVVFDQKNCIFIPHGLFARAGQVVNILNSDPILHNTHTYPNRSPQFNQGIEPNNTTGVPITYGQPEPEPVRVVCDIHAWMRAYHMVLDHPFGAVSGEDGSFEIADLPAGTHQFRVWHESAQGGYLTRNLEVTINADETTEMDIEYPSAKYTFNADPDVKTVEISSLLNR